MKQRDLVGLVAAGTVFRLGEERAVERSTFYNNLALAAKTEVVMWGSPERRAIAEGRVDCYAALAMAYGDLALRDAELADYYDHVQRNELLGVKDEGEGGEP